MSKILAERYERMDRFVRSWCTLGMPGTIPFFEAYVHPVIMDIAKADNYAQVFGLYFVYR